MAHVNQQVREAAEGRLEAIAGLTVVTGRGMSLIDSDLPAALVATASSDAELSTKGDATTGPTELREIDLTVVVVAEGDSPTLDDEMDGLQAQVESALGADNLGGLAHLIEFTGHELDLATDEEGERWYAFLGLAWRVSLFTELGEPEVAL